MIRLEPNRTPWDVRFSLLKVPIRIHPWYWLTSLLLCYRPQSDFWLVLISFGCMFLSILVHEFGHIFCQKHYGDRGNYIVFWGLGGLACGTTQPPGYAARVWISLWGPFAGFIFGALVYVLGGILYGWSFPWGNLDVLPNRFAYSALNDLFWFNTLWGAVNLLPVYPLDGGQILMATAERNRKPAAWAFSVSAYAALGMVLLCIAAYFSFTDFWLFKDPFVAILFAILAGQNFYFAWKIKKMGGFDEGGGEPYERREAWEQDPDWWKK